jgi:zinc protease
MRILLFASLFLAVPLLPAQQLAIQKHTLANGMTLILHEDHDIPNVAMYFFYKVGSRNEGPGVTGLSHFFEHMMFNGAKKYGPKQFDIVMENAGGRNNGYTSKDMTVYQDWFPSPALEQIFDLEADRIRDLAFDPKIIESERGVVYSERRLSVDNNPIGALYEQLGATAYTAHPYNWSPIGWPSDIETWTLDDLKQHWSMGYAPNNCVVVMAGDFVESEALALARKYLEPIPRRAGPPPVKTKEPPQQGERRVNLERPAQLPIQLIGYHVPASGHADRVTLEVLNSLLTEGRSSRLYRRLVEKDQLALEVAGFSEESMDPGLWIVQIQPRDGVAPAQTEQALYGELDRVSREAPTAAELQAAKNRLLANFYRQMKTIAGKANFLGQFEIYFGDAAKVADYQKLIQQVTAEDAQRVARTYLHAKNRTVATLVPTPEKKEAQ